VWYPNHVTNNAGQSIQAQENMIYDPVTGNQFTGNVIPSARISPMAHNSISTYATMLHSSAESTTTQDTHPKHSKPDSQSVCNQGGSLLRDQDHLSGSWIYDHKPRTLDDGGGDMQAGTQNGGPLSNAR